MPFVDTQYQIYAVDENYFCYWDSDISKEVNRFLENMDPTFFESMAKIFLPYFEETESTKKQSFLYKLSTIFKSTKLKQNVNNNSDPLHAALALRMYYSQSLETLFSLLCAAVQAPLCVHAWMLQYKPFQLKELLQKIEHGTPFPWQLKATSPSWDEISKFIHMSLILDDKEKEATIKREFSKFWSYLASDYVKQGFTDEYNSIKHGFRVKSGGFYIAIGKENEPGVPAPKESMQLLGASKYGSAFNTIEKIGDGKFHHQIKGTSQNWSPTDIAWALQLISISNVISALKILNGIPADKVDFQTPIDLEMFSEPWNRSKKLGVTSMTFLSHRIHPELIKPFTREELIDKYTAANYSGIIRRNYPNEE